MVCLCLAQYLLVQAESFFPAASVHLQHSTRLYLLDLQRLSADMFYQQASCTCSANSCYLPVILRLLLDSLASDQDTLVPAHLLYSPH